MKRLILVVLHSFALIIFEACCFGNAKCPISNYGLAFRLVAANSGINLVFGPNKVYDKNAIKFYSLNGTDTIFQQYTPGAFTGSTDSLLFVNFDYKENSTVYVQLSNTDVDTIIVNYQKFDGSPCCADYTILKPVSYNSNYISQNDSSITMLKK